MNPTPNFFLPVRQSPSAWCVIWLTAGTTVLLVVYYIFDIFNQFKVVAIGS